jgi:hypothetical protein
MATATADPGFDRAAYEAACRRLERSLGDFPAHKAAMDELERGGVALGPGLKAGRLVAFPHADGYAHYMIARVGARSCHLLPIPYGDAYRSPVVTASGSCPRATVEQALRRTDGMRALFAERDREQATALGRLPVGSTVYYRGLNGWTRGIVEVDGFRPVALLGALRRKVGDRWVGDRSPHDLWTVDRTGKVSYGSEVRWLREGKLDRPRPEDIWGPDYRRRGPDDIRDPATLPELPLDPPPSTAGEAQTQRLWGACEEIAALLADRDPDGIPLPVDRLERARRMIADALSW